MEARRWLEGISFPAERPLINGSQAAPVDPPVEPLRRAIAEAALSDDTAHLYGPVLGLPDLRAALASEVSALYRGAVAPEQVAITAGCNEAFAAAISTLAAPGDEVILPTPWYFNHKMWLDMAGIKAVPLRTGPDLVPRLADAEALITAKTRAIVLVTPNNPGGVEYPAELLAGFYDLAKAHGIALIVDETYRDFDSRPSAYFAYVEHPYAEEAEALCKRMVGEIGVLALPGSMFMPARDQAGTQQIRIAFANIDVDEISELFQRLSSLSGTRR
ncbi:MAG: aminotransferase class I/II-fold pyridoxal phosphate-dependent enzyme [Maritimibacter sp.]